jgi:hypothetical protein
MKGKFLATSRRFLLPRIKPRWAFALLAPSRSAGALGSAARLPEFSEVDLIDYSGLVISCIL